jgi:hypothetical protein
MYEEITNHLPCPHLHSLCPATLQKEKEVCDCQEFLDGFRDWFLEMEEMDPILRQMEVQGIGT